MSPHLVHVAPGNGPPAWPQQQALAYGVAAAPEQQPHQQQPDMRTPAPLGAKRKFVASPPPEAVSPLFSTPGEKMRPAVQSLCEGCSLLRCCRPSRGTRCQHKQTAANHLECVDRSAHLLYLLLQGRTIHLVQAPRLRCRTGLCRATKQTPPARSHTSRHHRSESRQHLCEHQVSARRPHISSCNHIQIAA